MDNINEKVIKEIVSNTHHDKKKKKKKKKKKSKDKKKDRSRSRRRRRDSTSAEESEDPFYDAFNEAVLDTNLDTAAERQLKQLAHIQAELDDLRKPIEEDDEQQFIPPSNQQAQDNAKVKNYTTKVNPAQ